ncbi:hypothetical protein Zmor_024833 [Zophobas morio]|uniref:non-specific serine/threonine protein kinase n=1 Tax=Zophobas morio TaxID=2755281 RepID=A0AA38HJ32_9CUCU|nr:hypothetical protein Zmor_024833 [Zophobas morio]
MNNEVNSLQLGKLSSQPTQIPEQNDLNLTHLKGRCPEDFDLLSIIGEGSYATVYLGKYKTSGKLYAVKVLDKRHMVREGKAKYAAVEKEALRKLSPHPYIVRLYYTFQDTYKLYFVLGYAKNGELLYYIRKLGSFGLDCVKFYSAELILAMEYMHSKGIVHRDIKPENLLLCENMHLILADFGTAKIISLVQDDSPLGRVSSFVGTADYVSPELLNYKRTSISSDLWALGCIIYQLIAGWPPFRGGTDYLTFQKVSNLDYTIPDGFPEEAADLIKQILVLDPQQRLGSNSRGGYENLKGHIFFEEVLWEQLHETTPPELKPYLPLADGPRGLTSEMNVGGDGILAHTAKNSLTASLTNDTNDYRHYTEAEGPS